MGAFDPKKRGDKGPIPVEAWNAFLVAEQKSRAFSDGGAGSKFSRSATIVIVENTTATNVEQFGILGIDAPIVTPTQSEDEFRSRVQLSGVEPAAEHAGGRSVITLEAIAAGATGRAVVSGAIAVKIKTPGDPDDVFAADVDPEDFTHLVATDAGAWRVLWIQSVADAGETEEVPNDRWAIVSAIGASGAPVQMKIVSVQDDWLTCSEWDGTTLGDAEILVAKPWELRKTDWHGETVNGVGYSEYGTGSQLRKASYPDYIQYEVLNLQYFAGAIITATAPRNGTGVVDDDDAPIALEDDNRGARRFVPKLYKLSDCAGLSPAFFAVGDLEPSDGQVVKLVGDDACYQVAAGDETETGGVVVAVESRFGDCDECREIVCFTTTICGGATPGPNFSTTGVPVEVGDVFAHDGVCYTIATIITCVGTENLITVSVDPDCETCASKCFELEKCNEAETKITVQGIYVVGNFVMIDSVCYTVARQVECPETPDAPTAVIYPSCETCNAPCYELTNCLDPTDTLNIKGVGWDDFVGKRVSYDGKCWTISSDTCTSGETSLDYSESMVIFDECNECQATISCTGDCAGKDFITADGSSVVDADGAEVDALANLMEALAEFCPSGASDLCESVVYINAEESGGTYTVTATICFKCCCREGETLIEVVIPPITCVDGEITYETEWVCKPACSNPPE